MAYKEEEYLQLSGLQHFSFCRRQWALIHIEQQWAENLRTADGRILHEKAHDASLRERRGDLLITRDMSVHSPTLGISGSCDVVEFHHGDSGIPLPEQTGLWQPYPVEYKRGEPKSSDADRLQLCAQAMCLEEMLCCDIPEGALFYGEIRRREKVAFSEELRDQVRTLLTEMHELYRRSRTPQVKTTKGCSACSLRDLCLPKLTKKRSVREYMQKNMGDLP
ncbi:MAG: CRISPR-associated protein Cas4 [Oscillospiraceae bacterium]|nr:CRISPR-associated protein Cas4 [Oscillospiraceae bacterium]